jgi:hypothetical protein
MQQPGKHSNHTKAKCRVAGANPARDVFVLCKDDYDVR